jgi:hypothetical protein
LAHVALCPTKKEQLTHEQFKLQLFKALTQDFDEDAGPVTRYALPSAESITQMVGHWNLHFN